MARPPKRLIAERKLKEQHDQEAAALHQHQIQERLILQQRQEEEQLRCARDPDRQTSVLSGISDHPPQLSLADRQQSSRTSLSTQKPVTPSTTPAISRLSTPSRSKYALPLIPADTEVIDLTDDNETESIATVKSTWGTPCKTRVALATKESSKVKAALKSEFGGTVALPDKSFTSTISADHLVAAEEEEEESNSRWNAQTRAERDKIYACIGLPTVKRSGSTPTTPQPSTPRDPHRQTPFNDKRKRSIPADKTPEIPVSQICDQQVHRGSILRPAASLSPNRNLHVLQTQKLDGQFQSQILQNGRNLSWHPDLSRVFEVEQDVEMGVESLEMGEDISMTDEPQTDNIASTASKNSLMVKLRYRPEALRAMQACRTKQPQASQGPEYHGVFKIPAMPGRPSRGRTHSVRESSVLSHVSTVSAFSVNGVVLPKHDRKRKRQVDLSVSDDDSDFAPSPASTPEPPSTPTSKSNVEAAQGDKNAYGFRSLASKAGRADPKTPPTTPHHLDEDVYTRAHMGRKSVTSKPAASPQHFPHKGKRSRGPTTPPSPPRKKTMREFRGRRDTSVTPSPAPRPRPIPVTVRKPASSSVKPGFSPGGRPRRSAAAEAVKKMGQVTEVYANWSKMSYDDDIMEPQAGAGKEDRQNDVDSVRASIGGMSLTPVPASRPTAGAIKRGCRPVVEDDSDEDAVLDTQRFEDVGDFIMDTGSG